MRNLCVVVTLTVLLSSYVYSANEDYLNDSSLFRTPEVNFWTYDLNGFNEVRIVYQIVDADREIISIDGATDWAGSRKLDIVSHLNYEKSYINGLDPTLYSILQEVSFGGAFLYKAKDLYSIYAGASGYTRGDTETLGNDDTFRISGRTAFGYDIDAFRLVGGIEVVRDNGMGDYSSFYFEVTDGFYVLPVVYANWEVFEGINVNVGFPYNSFRLKPFTQLEIGGVYDFRSDYIEAVVRFRPFNNRFFLLGRYHLTEVRDIELNTSYTSTREMLAGGIFISQETTTYCLDVGYNLPVLAADLIVAARGGFFESGDIGFRDGKGEETAVFAGDRGYFGGMSITTDF